MKRKQRKEEKRQATRLRRSSHVAPFALLLFFISLSQGVAFPLDLPSSAPVDSRASLTETREGRLSVFDDVWQTINDRYYDPSFHGIDWQREREEFRPLAA